MRPGKHFSPGSHFKTSFDLLPSNKSETIFLDKPSPRYFAL